MSIWRKFLPDRYYSIGIILLGIVVVAILCLPSIVARLGYDDPKTQLFAHGFFASVLAVLAASKLVSNLVIVAFWGTLGFLIYLVTWIGANALIEFRNQATMNTAYINRSSLFSTLKGPLEHLGAGLLFLIIAISNVLALKFWSALATEGIMRLPGLLGIVYLLGAIGGVSLGLLLTTVMWRFTHWVASNHTNSEE